MKRSIRLQSILLGFLLIALVVAAEYVEWILLEAEKSAVPLSVDLFPAVISIPDVQVFLWINNDLANPFFGGFFSVLTWLGDTGFTLIAAILLYLTGRRRAGILLFASVIVGTLVVLPLKLVIPRPRPFDAIPSAIAFGRESGLSFPSGHTVRVFASAYVFSSLWPRFKAPLYLIACLVGFSRIYLGQHYPSDVLGGILVGLLVGFLVIRHETGIMKRISRFGVQVDGLEFRPSFGR